VKRRKKEHVTFSLSSISQFKTAIETILHSAISTPNKEAHDWTSFSFHFFSFQFFQKNFFFMAG